MLGMQTMRIESPAHFFLMNSYSELVSKSQTIRCIANLIGGGFGINGDAALLMMLQTTGALAGRSLVVRSVNGVVCTPGFDLAVFSNSSTMLHGAQMALLDPILAEFQAAKDREESKGREHARHRCSSLMTKNTQLQEQRKAAEDRLRKAGETQTGQSVQWNIGQRERDRKAIEASIEALTQEIIAVQREIIDWKFSSAAGLVRDEGGWLEFPKAGGDSFDGNFLQLGSATSLLQDDQILPPKWFRESTELLRRSRRESPFSVTATPPETTTCSMQITGDPFTFARLFHDPKFASAGLFAGFLLVEADAGDTKPDLDAMAQLAADEGWKIILEKNLSDRLCNARHQLHMDREGAQYCLEFQEWYWNFVTELPDQHRWSFSGWPPLLVSLAMSCAIVEGKATGEILDASFLRCAGDLLKAHAPRQVAILESLQPHAEVDHQFEARIERLMLRLTTQGPMTKRDMARTISGNNYRVIDALLAEAKRRGLVLQKENHFVAVGVNVDASTAKRVIDFQEGVAA